MVALAVLRFCMSIDDRGELTFLSLLNYQRLSSHFVLRTIHPLVHCPCPRPIHLILHSRRRRIDLIFPLHCICPIYFNLFTYIPKRTGCNFLPLATCARSENLYGLTRYLHNGWNWIRERLLLTGWLPWRGLFPISFI